MASLHSFKQTIENNKTEKIGIKFLIDNDKRFYLPSKEEKKELLKSLNIDQKYIRAFDLVYFPNYSEFNISSYCTNELLKNVILIELKTTKKYLPNLPKGFFFGATQNEFDFGKILGDLFKFCFVSINEKQSAYAMLSLSELESIIKTKRIQYQINL